MFIEYIAHATFALDLKDKRRIIIDPYRGMDFNGRFNYPAYKTRADIAVLTHEHADHGWLGDLSGNPLIVRQAWQDEKLRISSVFAWHDKYQGTKFHGHVMMKCIEAENIRIAHLGDVGEVLSDEQIALLGHVDILILPVGGFYTIDGNEAYELANRIQPRAVIPCHYKTSLCTLPIEGPERFLSHYDQVNEIQYGPVDVSRLPNGVVWLADKYSSRGYMHELCHHIHCSKVKLS